MKTLKISHSFVLAVLFLISSCSKNDDSTIISENPNGVGMLSFGTVPVVNSRSVGTVIAYKQMDCSKSLKMVRIALKDSQGNCFYGNSKSGFHEFEMSPNGYDTNNDAILDTWNTVEDKKLMLPVGTYTLEYFAVLNNSGKDSQIIMMAPRKGNEDNPIQLNTLVSNSLPLEINIREGLEHYLPIEVLCFTRDQANVFGFYFIEYDDPDPFYLCSI
ncbi:hypothetical protein [Gillisia limnaea]|uniref:Lipoprotein n=1 Tax=Gillisia limnaea (strain DSM 15749 / LMG 21470 / R-8282) TaxID=865937 RepID=H2BSC4_GILLR|nr:hypothetical protein [Gillisia limnaea]EHQ01447.1 hypothetical protein Gilli_0743 [Gillisia limnaea DSM 15749]